MSVTPDQLRKAGERLEAIDPGLGGECFQAAETIEEMQHENELFDDDLRAKQRLIDRIADLIGQPHDRELEQVDFELWFTKNVKGTP